MTDSAYGHATYLAQTRQGLRHLGEHEAGICDQVGHEPRPVAGGKIACVCCGVPLPDPASTTGTKHDTTGGA